jgi:phage shock protein A
MKTQIEILKQKLLDTEEDHTTGITREEIECIKAKLDSLHRELVEATNNQSDWKQLAEQALSAAECFHLFWEEGFGTAGGAEKEYLQALVKYKQIGGVFQYATSSPPNQPRSE